MRNLSANKQKKKKGKKTRKEFQKELFLTEQAPYRFSTSYISHLGKYATILKLYIQTGTNKEMSYYDVLDFIPIGGYSNVTTHLITKDNLITGDEKKSIIQKNASKNKDTLQTEYDIAKKEGKSDAGKEEESAAEMGDYSDYEILARTPDPIVVFDWFLLVIADTKEAIEEQIELLNTGCNKRHKGAYWDSVPGVQYNSFSKLFENIPQTVEHKTCTSYNYAGLNLAVRDGLIDRGGLPIGRDASSLSGTTAYFNFNDYMRGQSIISIPKTSKMYRYYKEDELVQQPISSILAQLAANHVCFNKHKVKHIVLNDFDYLNKNGIYYRPTDTNKVFEEIDVSKLTINPLEGFGKAEDSTNPTELMAVYSNLIEKNTNIFSILKNFNLSDADRATIAGALRQFYFDEGLWNNEVEKYPSRVRVMNIENPNTYPTLVAFLNQFESMRIKAMRENRENKADMVDTLQEILQSALSSYTSILARPTSVKESNARQVYYKFNNLPSNTVKQVQFLNLLDYIINTCDREDLIVIHGYDSIYSKVSSMALPHLKRALNKGIKILYTFDTNVGIHDGMEKLNDMYDMQHKYYKDLGSETDWIFVGRLLADEVEKFETALNSNLSDTIRSNLMDKTDGMALVHRQAEDVNNFIRLDFLL